MELTPREIWDMKQRLEFHQEVARINTLLTAVYQDVVDTGDLSTEQATEICLLASQVEEATAKLRKGK